MNDESEGKSSEDEPSNDELKVINERQERILRTAGKKFTRQGVEKSGVSNES